MSYFCFSLRYYRSSCRLPKSAFLLFPAPCSSFPYHLSHIQLDVSPLIYLLQCLWHHCFDIEIHFNHFKPKTLSIITCIHRMDKENRAYLQNKVLFCHKEEWNVVCRNAVEIINISELKINMCFLLYVDCRYCIDTQKSNMHIWHESGNKT